jgi:hypothetical protein
MFKHKEVTITFEKSMGDANEYQNFGTTNQDKKNLSKEDN